VSDAAQRGDQLNRRCKQVGPFGFVGAQSHRAQIIEAEHARPASEAVRQLPNSREITRAHQFLQLIGLLSGGGSEPNA
jgi:hypothetical protein